ncbi:MAG: hypothetical protein ACR2K3_05415 [Nocardioides sp.]
MPFPLADLDTAATLAAAESATQRRRAVEVEDLELLAHWAMLHGNREDHRPGDRFRRLGGEGTPELWELSTAEIAIARQVHPASCDRAIADVLDLLHRLPLTWRVVKSLKAEVWVARKVASLCRALPLARVGIVDSAVAAAIGGQAPSRVLAIAEAKVIEADPDTYAAKLEEQRRRRFVGLGRVDEFGLRHVIARIEAGDAVWVDAMVDRVADILATRDDTPRCRDELRAEAFGWLARPAELLALLLEHGTDDDALRQSRSTAMPADLLDKLTHAGLARLRPRAKLHVHLHRDVLGGEVTGVARVEGVGPMLPAEALEFLARTTRGEVAPVIDLADQISVNSYEHPQGLKDRIHLSSGGDYFPYATCVTRNVDLDHPTPYDPGGPPGQTGTHNCGPLTRRHHRVKTHTGFTATQLGPGRYLWRTPHGHELIIDHTGTHRLPRSGIRIDLAYEAA